MPREGVDYLIDGTDVSTEVGLDMRTDIIKPMVMGLIFIILVQNCTAAAPMQLSGGTGRSILESVANVGINSTLNNTINAINATNNTANETTNQTAFAAETKKGLWGWGKSLSAIR